MKELLFLLGAGLWCFIGCGHYQRADAKTAPAAAGQTKALSETEVLPIARRTVATSDTRVDRAEFETPRRQADGSWSIIA